jgi:alpha-glucosidase
MKLLLSTLAAALLVATSAITAQAQSAQPRIALESVTAAKALPNGIELQSGPATIQIVAMRQDIIRIRIAPTSTLPEDASWAVVPASRTATVPVQANGDGTGFKTAALQVKVERNPLRILVQDLDGKPIVSDALSNPTEFANGGFTVHKQMPGDEQFYGLGDKLGTFNRRNQAYTNWNTDIGPQEAIDPLYKSIPFFLGTTGGLTYGLFLDNTWRSWFDFGKQSRDNFSFGSDGGPLDYYVIYGPTPKQVVEGYAYLTGTPPLPPMWALGFQQSRYSYYPESDLRRVATRLRTDKIPSDVVYLDIDYQYRNRPFTVDPTAFPDFPKLIADLKAQHLHLVTITDLHIAHQPKNYAPYETGHAGDNFVKAADGKEFVGVVWPGPAVFPDYTRAQTRDWWGTLYKEFATEGVSGFWNDMNEPSVFGGPGNTMPLDNIHRIEGASAEGFADRTATHAEIHNIFGMQNERATYEGLLKILPNERPFVLTRATYAGGQRYGFTWTGDNSSTYNHLRLSTQQLINLGLSGISMVGDDIGGFNGSANADLLTRWIEVGAFNPMYRDHSTYGSLPQEVWVHGVEQEAIRRRYIETRYRLLPYIYTLAEEASRTGHPLMRPIFFEFPEVLAPNGPYVDHTDTEFLLGRSILVAPPPFAEMPEDYAVGYPPGDWYDFWTGKKMPPQATAPDIVAVSNAIEKGKTVVQANEPQPYKIHPDIQTLAVYIRGGSIIPMQPLVQSTSETPSGPLTLRVYPGPGTPKQPCEGSLYLDDGHTFAYKQGQYLRQSFTCSTESKSVSIHFAPREGSYKPWWNQIEVVLYNWSGKQATATLGSSALKTTYDPQSQTLHITIPDQSTEADLRIK